MLDRALLPIVGTTEKVERTKLMWRYFVSILVTLGPSGGPRAAGQPLLPPDAITTALRQAIAATNVDEGTWLPAMQVLVMKESHLLSSWPGPIFKSGDHYLKEEGLSVGFLQKAGLTLFTMVVLAVNPPFRGDMQKHPFSIL
jgi:hypothetical protein